MTIHTFTSSGDAYDACQSDDTIHNGDTLIVRREGVVGLAWTWPIAVTIEHGDLHTVCEESGALDRVLLDSGIAREQVTAAVAIATSYGFAVRPLFLLD